VRLVPVSFAEACAFVAAHHRHHAPPAGHKFSIGVAVDDVLVGVAIIGRPVARWFDDGLTLEVARTATDGTRNANSMLYGAAWRAARALGYRRVVTYTQAGESGGSLRAVGWRTIAQRPARPRVELPQPTPRRQRPGLRATPLVGGVMTGRLASTVPASDRCRSFALGLLHVLAADPWTGGAAGSRAGEAKKSLVAGCRVRAARSGLLRRALEAAAEAVTLRARREGARPLEGTGA
jgi:hypothetical protein